MRKTLLASIFALGIAIANQVHVDVPITINHTGGCVFEGLQSTYDFGSVPFTAYTQLTGSYDLPPISFGVKCTAGLNYSVSIPTYSFGQDALILQRGNDSSVRLGLYRDSGRAQKITGSNPQITSGTGSGSTQTITIYPRLEGCGSSTCSPGTYSKTVTIRITH